MSKDADRYLRRWTGQGSSWWLDRIGNLIAQNAKPIKGAADKRLKSCIPHGWLNLLGKELWHAMDGKISDMADENIAFSRVLSVILTLWTARIIRAKSYDPRRLVKQRRYGMTVLLEYQQTILSCLVDETRDASYFPSQEWDMPHSPTARHEPDEMELLRQQHGKRKAKGKP